MRLRAVHRVAPLPAPWLRLTLLLLYCLPGHKLNRARLVGVACWYWAVCTALFAYSNSTWQGMVLWGFNGVGLGVMVPNAQSLIADYYDATHRGRAFGMLLAVGERFCASCPRQCILLNVMWASNVAFHVLGANNTVLCGVF